jgi:hypothetical protein
MKRKICVKIQLQKNNSIEILDILLTGSYCINNLINRTNKIGRCRLFCSNKHICLVSVENKESWIGRNMKNKINKRFIYHEITYTIIGFYSIE